LFGSGGSEKFPIGGILVESHFTQLRFDISEKVRLHPQQPGIDALLELDLYPDVEIKDEGQHLKIQGYLRLNGAYLAQEQESEELNGLHTDHLEEENRNELAYVIPVEITLPADRAEQTHIVAEVESFDYRVISPFELQIEAILMIDGLLPEAKEESDSAHEESEGPIFSGEPARPLTVYNEEFRFSELEQSSEARMGSEEDSIKPMEEQEEESVSDAKVLPFEESQHQMAKPKQQLLKEEPVQANPLKEKKAEPKPTKQAVKPRVEEAKPAGERETADFAQSPKDFWQERQQSKQHQQNDAENAMDQEPAQTEPIEDEERSKAKSQADWIRWLVGNKEEKFVAMKMVIVQKDETIDHVAQRYEISVEKLLKLNRLQTDLLEEGQILYVPAEPGQITS
jgi:stage VI sporulation protein D